MRTDSLDLAVLRLKQHIYDLAVIAQHPKVSALLSDSDKLKRLLEIRVEEEKGRLDGIPGVVPTGFIFLHRLEIIAMSAKRMKPCRTNMSSENKIELSLRQR